MKTSDLDYEMWADIVIKEWLQQINALAIIDSHALIDSFRHHIHKSSGGDVGRIQFVFNYYGKFVEMGVGRSFPIELRGDASNKREAKPWKSKTFMRQVYRLQELMQNQLAADAQKIISAGVSESTADGLNISKV